MSERSTARSARTTLYRSTGKSILPLRRIPAVSMRMNSFPLYVQCVSMESRVVPGILLTMTRSCPRSALVRDDFPTFGRPTSATWMASSLSSSTGTFLIYFSTSSRRSPRFMRLTAEMPIGRLVPDYKIRKY